jgi:hypothetical protein
MIWKDQSLVQIGAFEAPVAHEKPLMFVLRKIAYA